MRQGPDGREDASESLADEVMGMGAVVEVYRGAWLTMSAMVGELGMAVTAAAA